MLTLDLFDHCVTRLEPAFTRKPRAVVFMEALLSLPDDVYNNLSADTKRVIFEEFFLLAETRIIKGMLCDSWVPLARFTILGQAWVRYQRTHGYPQCCAFTHVPEWHAENLDVRIAE